MSDIIIVIYLHFFSLEALNRFRHLCTRNSANITRDKLHYALRTTFEKSTQHQRYICHIISCKVSFLFSVCVSQGSLFFSSLISQACMSAQMKKIFLTKEKCRWICASNSSCGIKYSYIRS